METREFGRRLRELRKQAGLSQRELADNVKIDFTYLSKIENGVMPPPSEKVTLRLAEVLNADKDELMTLAGKIPSDIVQMLRNRETLQFLRSDRTQKKIQAANKKEGISIMKNLVHYKRLTRIVGAAVLVLAVGASLWFASPASALTISFPTLPSSGTLGSTYSFTVKVEVKATDLLPIKSVDLEIYNSNTPSYKASCTKLPPNTGTKSYTSTQTGGGAVNIVATAAAGWGYGYGYRRGYGYEATSGWGYYYPGYGYGWGYGYSSFVGATSITYSVTWSVPAGWPTGSYTIKVWVNANGESFTQTSTFTISAPPAATAGLSAPPGVADISRDINASGVFTADVTAQSDDDKVSLSIETGTKGLTKYGTPLSWISIREMAASPPPPADSEAIGLVYDLRPDGATFDQPITITLTYDEAQIPPGVAEENLYIAMWDEDASEWVRVVSVVDPDTNTITAEISHFTLFTVIASTRPAAFVASALSITPAEVDIGEKVTISVLISNTGDLTGSPEVSLKIDNVTVDTETITLHGRTIQKVTFTTTKDTAGTYAVTVNGLTGEFVVRAAPAPAPAPAKPAAFTTSVLTISPTEVDIGESITISALVTNTGDLSGSYEVTLKINNVAVATKDVTLAGGASQKITFTTTKDITGTHTVNVDGLSGSFTVKVPPAPAPKLINWWVISAIIAGAIIIGVIIWLVARRRRAQV